MSEIFKNFNCIGILGGTFNPVHKGHIMLVNEVNKQFPDIEHLFIMPNNMPAYKENQSIISSEHRINMLQLAISNTTNTSVSDIEIQRGGTTYTIDTLRQIKAINPDIKIYFIIGADSLYNIEKWRDFQDIFDNCVIIAAKRDCNLEDIINYSNELIKRHKNLNIQFIDTKAIDISSSELRDNISINILDNRYLDEKVIQYIKTNNLYGWNS